MLVALTMFLFRMQAVKSDTIPPPVDQSSARCLEVVASPDERITPLPQIAPGPPPLLSFRYYEGQLHHRYSNSDLMLDDAGH